MLVSEGVYALSVETPGPLKTINSYLLTDGSDSYLVDTNWPATYSIEHLGYTPPIDSWSSLMGLFDEAGIDPKRLKGIIVTHTHADHFGHLTALQELSGAPALLHRDEVQAHEIRSGVGNTWRESMGLWFRQHGTPEDIAQNIVEHSPTFPAISLGTVRPLSDGEVITVGSMRWEVVWTPGHSPGHICLLERRRGLILTGDHVLPHDTPNIHAHPEFPSNPLGRYIDSLRKVSTLSSYKGLPGHGGIIDDFQAVVSYLITHHDTRCADVVGSLQSGTKTAFEVACAIPWVSRRKRFIQLSHRERWMALSEAIAHLEALEAREMIEQVSHNGHIAYHLSKKIYDLIAE